MNLDLPGGHYLPEYTLPTVKFGGGKITAWGCFAGFWLDPLFSVKGSVSVTANEDILDDSVF